MTVGSGVPYNEHTGNGTATVFAYEFTILEAGDFVATIDGTVTSAYSLTGVGNPAGGTCVFDTAPASGAVVLLRRVVALVRETDYQTNGDLQAETINADLDRLMMAIQDVGTGNAAIGNVIRAPLGEDVAELPAAADRASKLSAFDSNGDPIALTATENSAEELALDLLDGSDQSKGANLVSWLWTAASSVARRVRDKLREIGHITPEDFGAVGTAPGVTPADSTAALTAFFNSANSNPGIKHVVPRKWYGYSAALPTIDTSSVWIEGSGIGLHNVGSLTPHSCFIWLGGVSSSTGFTIEPDAGASNQFLTGLRVTGLNFSAGSVLAKNIVIRSVRNSKFAIGSYNATDTGITLGVLASSSLGENEGLQYNEIDIAARQVEAPGGVPLRLQGSATANVSMNRFGLVDIIHGNATGIIIENADNNVWELTRLYATGTATYSMEWLGGASEAVSCRGERFNKFTASLAPYGHGTGTYTYPSTNNVIESSDVENATPQPIYGTDATGTWTDTRGLMGGSTAGVTGIRGAFGEGITNATSAKTRVGTTGSVHIVNGSTDHVQLSDASNTNRWGFSIDGSGNLRFPRLAGSGYYLDTLAAYGNYANDVAAAAGGVPVGGRYRNGSVMMIRVS